MRKWLVALWPASAITQLNIFRKFKFTFIPNIFEYLNLFSFQFSWIFPRLWFPIILFAKSTWRLRQDPFRTFQNRIMAEVTRRKREKMEQKRNEAELNEQQEMSKQREHVDFIDLFLDAESEEPIAQNGNSQGTFQRAEAKVRFAIFEIRELDGETEIFEAILIFNPIWLS